MTEERVKISFDSEYKIRLYEEAKANRSDSLQSEALQFVEKTGLFNDKVKSLVTVLEAHADRIESQKIRAIGLRMAADNETDQRNKHQRALQAIISEKRAELDRFVAQYQSLERIEAEQRVLLDKLTSSHTNSK